MEDGFTKEEWKMTVETRKILDPDIAVVAHCVRVPVFIGHSEAVFIETRKPIDETSARAAVKGFPGLVVIDHRAAEGYVTPVERDRKRGVEGKREPVRVELGGR